MSDDDKKIVFKKSVASDLSSQSTQTKEEVQDLASSLDFSHKGEENQDTDISKLQSEIENLIKEIDAEHRDEENFLSKKDESREGSPVLSAASVAIEKKKQDHSQELEKVDTLHIANETQTKEEEKNKEEERKKKIEELKKSIFAEAGKNPEEVEKSRKKGIEETYYSDLSQAMGANKPETVAELLERDRFEKKEKEIRSPRSKKNLFYIIASLIFLAFAFGLIYFLFSKGIKKNKNVQFIKEKKVSALVYADKDLGLNITDVGKEKLKQAIRKANEMNLEKGDIGQIYYVKKDSFANLRRVGIKQVFDQSGITPPKKLYDNIENHFMHGVYRADKNYPFLILKAISYDRAFEGMKEWEPSMVDDLAPYLNLPKEAGDRSLLEDGFSDTIVKNKTARIVRFLPRERDRKGLIQNLKEIFKKKKAENTQSQNNGNLINENSTQLEHSQNDNGDEIPGSHTELPVKVDENNDGNLVARLLTFVEEFFDTPHLVYAQTTKKVKKCFKVKYTCMDFAGDTVDCTKDILDCNIGHKDAACVNGNDNILVSSEILNKDTDPIYDWSPEKADSYDYACMEVDDNAALKDDTFIDDVKQNTSDIDYVCYQKEQRCYDNKGNIVPYNPDDLDQVCFDVIHNNAGDQEFSLHELRNAHDEDYISEHYSCVQAAGSEIADNIGDNNHQGENTICFPSHWECFDAEGKDAPYNPNDTSLTCHKIIDDMAPPVIGGIPDSEKDNYICNEYHPEEKVMNSRKDFAWVGDLFENLCYPSTWVCVNYEGHVVRGKNPSEREDPDYYCRKEIDYAKVLSGDIKGVATVPYGEEDNYLCPGYLDSGNGLKGGLLVYPGKPIKKGSTLGIVRMVQEIFVDLGIMNPLSASGELDLLTQGDIIHFQNVNDLAQTGVLDEATLNLLNGILSGYHSLFGGSQAALINDYFLPEKQIGLGTYSQDVQNMQVVLFAEGYPVGQINGVFDQNLWDALQEYAKDHNLPPLDDTSRVVSPEILESLNRTIKEKGYLGSGYIMNGNGVLVGSGVLKGKKGPGETGFEINTAEAADESLREGEPVLIYTFLDEHTILIARDEVVIPEIIKRMAMNDIFNKVENKAE